MAFLVDGVTKVSQARAGMRNLDSYLPHTKDNLTKLTLLAKMRVIIIKPVDRLHNMRTLQFMTPEKQKKSPERRLRLCAAGHRLNMGRVRVQLRSRASLDI